MNLESVRVLVVIPALNEAATIARVLHSLMVDPVPQAEVVFVVADGGSVDGTQQIVQAIAAQQPAVTLLHNPRRIQSAAVNLALATHGQGMDVLVRCDAHAGYPPGFIGRLLDTMARHGADALLVERHLTRAARRVGLSQPAMSHALSRLRERFGHASAERAVSGPGLVNLHTALCELDGAAAEALDAAAISARAQAGDARAGQAVELFFAFLGTVAGNLALSLGARGGMYIGGGIVPRLGDRIDASPFRERFEAKGRFRDYLRGIPTFVVQASTSPALLGAARALEDL